MEQAPGPRGSPQRPQDPGAAAPEDGRLPVLTANVDSVRCSCVPSHAGQCGVS